MRSAGKLLLPGEDIVKTIHFNATIAVTINSMLGKIWNWTIQIVSKRAGGIALIGLIIKVLKVRMKYFLNFEKLKTVILFRFTPDQKNGMWV